MLCAMAQATHIVQHKAANNELQPNDDADGIVVSISDDATPMFLRFGQLRGLLEPFARYLVQAGGRWISLSYDEYLEPQGRHAPTTARGLEVFAILGKVVWTSSKEETEVVRDIYSSPLILERANASSSACALQEGIPSLSSTATMGLRATNKCILLTEAPDGVAYINA